MYVPSVSSTRCALRILRGLLAGGGSDLVVLGKKFVYYFFKENCAYRMAELLELVIGHPLLPDVPWALPETVFERIAALNRNGAPIVREIRRIPLRQNRFRASFLKPSFEHAKRRSLRCGCRENETRLPNLRASLIPATPGYQLSSGRMQTSSLDIFWGVS